MRWLPCLLGLALLNQAIALGDFFKGMVACPLKLISCLVSQVRRVRLQQCGTSVMRQGISVGFLSRELTSM